MHGHGGFALIPKTGVANLHADVADASAGFALIPKTGVANSVVVNH